MRITIVVGFLLLIGRYQAQTDSLLGKASFYAKKFEGSRTANGERFRHDSLTAAHKTLPFGTYVKVTNVKNDSVVVVRINDRLPKRSKRTIDLTKRAAKQLNFLRDGIAKVRIEELSSHIDPAIKKENDLPLDSLQTK